MKAYIHIHRVYIYIIWFKANDRSFVGWNRIKVTRERRTV